MGELTHVYVVCRTVYGDWSIDKDVAAVFTSREAVERAYGAFQWVWDAETAERDFCYVTTRKNELLGYNSELVVHYMPLDTLSDLDRLSIKVNNETAKTDDGDKKAKADPTWFYRLCRDAANLLDERKPRQSTGEQ